MAASLFRRTSSGYSVGLPANLRRLIGQVLEELRDELLMGNPDTLRRLFPPAYPDDIARQAEFAAMVHDDLLGRRLDAIDTVVAGLDADRISRDDLETWARVLNDVRLVLGTRLDVDEGHTGVPDDHPDALAHDVYDLLSTLLGAAIDALSH